MINVPLYEYECTECSKNFEVFMSMNDTQEVCIHCGSSEIRKAVPTLGNKINKNDFKSRVGDVVKKHIEDSSKELKTEKKRLKRDF